MSEQLQTALRMPVNSKITHIVINAEPAGNWESGTGLMAILPSSTGTREDVNIMEAAGFMHDLQRDLELVITDRLAYYHHDLIRDPQQKPLNIVGPIGIGETSKSTLQSAHYHILLWGKMSPVPMSADAAFLQRTAKRTQTVRISGRDRRSELLLAIVSPMTNCTLLLCAKRAVEPKLGRSQEST
ncbi:uncharacterized protein BJ212DRAFT_1585146 [Suillus subaureus]|uniref:Uncharacterized protein n=1 Tax=Suillus subaureus TaxID=48587 RepID=A0A9P7EK87_9AGAM|nr:uncharacterized protein BJ212DRAFT_1585146 [Suillus subaureus]KAG1823684.1 hypothetical protein BJ212DRAFT_1585146 [Suillus subaureus]